MVERLKQIASEIANSRVRLSHPFMDAQTRNDIIAECKRLEKIELNLRKTISDLEEKINFLEIIL